MNYTEGIFIIDSPIKINNDTVIKGAGINKTILVLNNPYEKNISSMILPLETTGINNVIISDLTIDMNFKFPITKTYIKPTPVIDFSNGNNSNIVIKNVKIVNTFTNNHDMASSAIHVTNCSNVSITNCLLSNIGKYGIHISGNSKDIILSYNRINNTGDDAINIKNTMPLLSNFHITNNFIYHCGGKGIHLLGINNAIVFKNYINYTQSSGIVVSNFNTLSTCNDICIIKNKLINIGFYQHPLNNNLYHNKHFNMIEIEKLKEINCGHFFNITIKDNIFYNSKGRAICIINLHPTHGFKNISCFNNKYENELKNLLIDIIHPEEIFKNKEWISNY